MAPNMGLTQTHPDPPPPSFSSPNTTHNTNTIPHTQHITKNHNSYGFERDLLRYLERLVRDMDRRIEKNRERAEAESRPRPVKPDDQRKLDEIRGRMEGAPRMHACMHACMLGRLGRQGGRGGRLRGAKRRG